MKQLPPLLLALLLSSCAGSKPVYRADTQKEYEKAEAVNQQKSLQRSELLTRRNALDFQISALNSQIRTQEDLIRRQEQQVDAARNQAMIDNARVRMRHLQQEQDSLLQQRHRVESELNGLYRP